VRVEPISRGRPEWASSEENWILDLLRNAGERGVSREHLIFTCRSTQCGRAIHSLERCGYVIEHVKLAGEKYVRYVLKSAPLDLKPLPESADWYERQTGKPHPQATDDLPFFAGGEL